MGINQLFGKKLCLRTTPPFMTLIEINAMYRQIGPIVKMPSISVKNELIDPSVAREGDPESVIPDLDMYNPDNGWRPWPEPCSYDREWLKVYRQAQKDRVARIDSIAKSVLETQQKAAEQAEAIDAPSDPAGWRYWRQRAAQGTYLTIYRTLADPAYLDLSIDPDDREMGSIFAAPDPLDANYGLGGLSRVMTARGWLSTWSALSSKARVAETIKNVTVPTLVIHATADQEIRMRQAAEIRDAAGSSDVSYHELEGADHYVQTHRKEAAELMIDWIRARFP